MARLWVFNPWNDLALGSDSTYYTPPPLVEALARSGQTLPMWMADAEDYVLVDEDGRKWWEQNSGKYNLARPWNGEPIEGCVPWGWSKAIRENLRVAGVEPALLLPDSALENIRRLSHRRLTVKAHEFLETGKTPIEAKNEEECIAALQRWGKVIGKYPWSSTGRGLFSGTPEHKESFLRRCRGAIAHQGSVMIEPAYDVVTDFAMLFRYKEGRFNFYGYSLFHNEKRAYVANLLLPDEEISRCLENFIEKSRLNLTARKMETFLTQEVGDAGIEWIGVDMMIYRNGDSYYELNPCVEINLRMTMGVLSHIILSHHLPSGFHGSLSIQNTFNNAAPFLTLNPNDSPFRFVVTRS